MLIRFQKNVRLSSVGEPVVLANSQPLDIKGKCELHICVNGVDVVLSTLANIVSYIRSS